MSGCGIFSQCHDVLHITLVPSCSRPLLEAAPVARLGASEMSGATVSWLTRQRRLKTLPIPTPNYHSHILPHTPTYSHHITVTFRSSHFEYLQINARKVPGHPKTCPFSNVESLHGWIRLVLLRHALSISMR